MASSVSATLSRSWVGSAAAVAAVLPEAAFPWSLAVGHRIDDTLGMFAWSGAADQAILSGDAANGRDVLLVPGAVELCMPAPVSSVVGPHTHPGALLRAAWTNGSCVHMQESLSASTN